jgi:hypothetical protein
VAVTDGAAVRRVNLAARGGQTVLPLTGTACRLELTLDEPRA